MFMTHTRTRLYTELDHLSDHDYDRCLDIIRELCQTADSSFHQDFWRIIEWAAKHGPAKLEFLAKLWVEYGRGGIVETLAEGSDDIDDA